MSVTLRPATLHDAETITALVHAAWKDGIDPRSSGHRLTVDGARQNLEAGGGFLIEDDGVALGCVCYWNDGSTLDLMKLAVHPNARGRGLALQLVSAVEAHAVQAGFERILLAVSLYNLSVIPFYERLGYVLDDAAEYKHASASSPVPRVMVKWVGQGRIQQIGHKVQLLKRLDRDLSVFGAASHKYALVRTTQTEDEELRNGDWPAEYVSFLHLVGSGAGPYYGLAHPRQSLEQAEQVWLLHHPVDDGDLDTVRRMAEAGATRNTLVPICDFGCGERFMLVLKGPEAGALWYDHGFGDNSIRPLDHSFLDFYERWVDHSLTSLAQQEPT